MTRAMLINPDEDPTWIDLDDDARTHLSRLLHGHETVALDREHGEDGPGVTIAVSECMMSDRDAPNGYATSIVSAFGQDWPVLGPAVLMWLDGRDVVDLTAEQWGWIVNVESGMVAAPVRPADHQVWLFHGADGTSKNAYITPDAARRAAIADYEAGDTGPGTPGVAYTWRIVGGLHLLAEDDTPTGWSVRPIRVLGSSPR
jgi:hypothetical protein